MLQFRALYRFGVSLICRVKEARKEKGERFEAERTAIKVGAKNGKVIDRKKGTEEGGKIQGNEWKRRMEGNE